MHGNGGVMVTQKIISIIVAPNVYNCSNTSDMDGNNVRLVHL